MLSFQKSKWSAFFVKKATMNTSSVFCAREKLKRWAIAFVSTWLLLFCLFFLHVSVSIFSVCTVFLVILAGVFSAPTLEQLNTASLNHGEVVMEHLFDEDGLLHAVDVLWFQNHFGLQVHCFHTGELYKRTISAIGIVHCLLGVFDSNHCILFSAEAVCLLLHVADLFFFALSGDIRKTTITLAGRVTHKLRYFQLFRMAVVFFFAVNLVINIATPPQLVFVLRHFDLPYLALILVRLMLLCKEEDILGYRRQCNNFSEKVPRLSNGDADHNGCCVAHGRPFSKVLSVTAADGSALKHLGCMDCEGAGQLVEEFVAELQEQVKTVLAEKNLHVKFAKAAKAKSELENRFISLSGDNNSAGSIQETCGMIDTFYNELIAHLNENREAMKAAVVKEGQSRLANLNKLHSRVLEVASTAHLASCLLEAVDAMEEVPLPLLVKASNVLGRANNEPSFDVFPLGVIDVLLPALDWLKKKTRGTVIGTRRESAVGNKMIPMSAFFQKEIVLQLNARGKRMDVSLSSLQKYPESRLCQQACCSQGKDPAFVDCDPAVMEVMLNSIGIGFVVSLPDDVQWEQILEESKRLGLPCLPLSEAAVKHELRKGAVLGHRNVPNLICRPGCRLGELDLEGFDVTGGNFSGCSFAGAKMAGCNLCNAILEKSDLSGADLSGAVLREANLSGATLVAAKFAGVDLSGRDFSGCDLSRANLTGADLTGAVLREANLSGATLVAAKFVRVDLSGRDFSGCDLSRANFSEADLSRAKFSEADLSGAVLREANLSGATLVAAKCVGVDLSGRDFSGADLSGANFSKADLSDAVLKEANLSGATLVAANFSEADLSDAVLKDANLSGATLVAAKFVGVDLSGGDFSGADLSGANFSGLDLSRANFSEADLSGTVWERATVSDANFSGARGLDTLSGVVAGSAFAVSGAGEVRFNGWYVRDGDRNRKPRYRNIVDREATCSFDGTIWRIGNNYFIHSGAATPPPGPWPSGGKQHLPTVTYPR